MFLLETKYPSVLEPALVSKPLVLLLTLLHMEWVCTDVPFPFDTSDGLQPYAAVAEQENPGLALKSTVQALKSTVPALKPVVHVLKSAVPALKLAVLAPEPMILALKLAVPPRFSVLHRTKTRL